MKRGWIEPPESLPTAYDRKHPWAQVVLSVYSDFLLSEFRGNSIPPAEFG